MTADNPTLTVTFADGTTRTYTDLYLTEGAREAFERLARESASRSREVTPKMVDVGLKILRDSGFDFSGRRAEADGPDKDLVREILSKALSVKP